MVEQKGSLSKVGISPQLGLALAILVIIMGLIGYGLPVSAKKSASIYTRDEAKDIPDVVLVKFKPAVAPAAQGNVSAGQLGVASADAKITKHHKQVKTTKIVTPGKKSDQSSDLARWIKVKVNNPGPPSTDVDGNTYYPEIESMIAELRQDPNVEAVEKDRSVPLSQVPNDPYYSTTGNLWGMPTLDDMWGLKAMNAEQAWDITTGSSSVVVGVVDTGVDYTHPDLAANMWHNPGEIPSNGIDDDHNGHIDDYYGWDFYDNDNAPTDYGPDDGNTTGHGTHVSGTIAAVGNNSIGVPGMSWHSKIMAVRACWATCAYSAIASSVQYATDMGARVLNNSYGGPGAIMQIEIDAIQYAHNHDVSFVASAGNALQDILATSTYPASDENAITVGAVDSALTKASFSNYGIRADVFAPGVNILSLKSTGWTHFGSDCPALYANLYCEKQGTSMAAPQVTGIIALMLSVNPSLTSEQIRQILRVNAKDLGAVGRDAIYGFGMAMADKSVAAAQSPTVIAPHISYPKYKNSLSGTVAFAGSVVGPNLSNYKLQAGVGQNPGSWTTILTGSSQVASDSTLINYNTYRLANSTYSIRLLATAADGITYDYIINDVTINNPVDVTAPTVPTNLTATPTLSSVTLNWSPSTDNSEVTLYLVKRNGVAIGSSATTSFTDIGLAPNTSYTYSLQAVDYAGLASAAATVSATTLSDITPPTEPAGFTVQSSSTHAISLSWTASTDDFAVAGYRIYRGGSLVRALLATSWTDSGLSLNTNYDYEIEAFDAAGNTSIRASLSAATLPDTIAPTVSFVSPSDASMQRRTVAVTVNSGDDEAVTQVELYRNNVLIKTLTASPYTADINIICLPEGTNLLKAIAKDAAGNSSEKEISITVSNPRRGDLNDDSLVNIIDLSMLAHSWGQIDITRDLDGNDLVNIFDLSILAHEYGK